MARNFSTVIHFEQRKLSAVFVPVMKPDGLHYEVNVQGFPRFFVAWSALGRYDIIQDEETTPFIPYELILIVSDLLEKRTR